MKKMKKEKPTMATFFFLCVLIDLLLFDVIVIGQWVFLFYVSFFA